MTGVSNGFRSRSHEVDYRSGMLMKVSVDGSRYTHAWLPVARRRPAAEEEVGTTFPRIRSQWQILAYLAQNEGINQKRLAELLDIEPITVGRIVDKLETLRLVKRNPHPTDRRRWLLHFMPAARGRLRQAGEYGDATRGEALAGVSEEDRQHLLKTLQALKQNLTQACETPPAGQKRANHG
jgi:MarR family transcriptional regulator for hemolysin